MVLPCYSRLDLGRVTDPPDQHSSPIGIPPQQSMTLHSIINITGKSSPLIINRHVPSHKLQLPVVQPHYIMPCMHTTLLGTLACRIAAGPGLTASEVAAAAVAAGHLGPPHTCPFTLAVQQQARRHLQDFTVRQLADVLWGVAKSQPEQVHPEWVKEVWEALLLRSKPVRQLEGRILGCVLPGGRGGSLGKSFAADKMAGLLPASVRVYMWWQTRYLSCGCDVMPPAAHQGSIQHGSSQPLLLHQPSVPPAVQVTVVPFGQYQASCLSTLDICHTRLLPSCSVYCRCQSMWRPPPRP